MKVPADLVIVTDIGSTTTKAIAIDISGAMPRILGHAQSPTTVESPANDVIIGISNSITQLSEQLGISILDRSHQGLVFREGVRYFSTSSAGGGLQILVIGLTLFDSASSGKRCAYGAGGVILDTFAMDDKRQAMEQMMAMRNLHPDMILICGGTDGGAISGVIRLAEIVRIANPAPKFDLQGKIPALYAGNAEAAEIIRNLISDTFDLFILPNIRPTLEAENLQPTQDMVQKLFMENVMEHAPGYGNVKQIVTAPIIPTPVGVHHSLAMISGNDRRNIFAFDIGGATTDVFSFINGHFQRTVSANLGLSYSAWNILRESGMDNIMRWLPQDTDLLMVRNYIANKCLHPTRNPTRNFEFRIEHALAREALSIALSQHRKMHYNGNKVGYLDKMKKDELCKYQRQFSYQKQEDKFYFKESDIDVLIGAGGVFTHTQNHMQTSLILIDAVRPKGLTEIWMDRDFISPHLGVFSESDPATARSLIENACFERLALHIAPLFSPKTRKPLLDIEIVTHGTTTNLKVVADTLIPLPAGPKTLIISPAKGVQLPSSQNLERIDTDLPVLIDTRLDPSALVHQVEELLNLYSEAEIELETTPQQSWDLAEGHWTRKMELPYAGDVNYQKGAIVEPGNIVAVNRYNPPRLYIINGFLNFPGITSQQIKDSLKVQIGDRLDFDQCYAELTHDYKVSLSNKAARHMISPIRGKIELIHSATGIIVLSEIQDYPTKPVLVHYADQLMLKPKLAKRYLRRGLNEFVYQGEVLARRLETSQDGAPAVFVKAPATGTITSIDTDSGILTIAYINKALDFPAHVHGEITATVPGRSIEIAYYGKRLNGNIAFGKECHGTLQSLENKHLANAQDLSETIAVLPFAPDATILGQLAARGAAAVICYQIDATELTAFLNYEPGVINTGNESMPLTILIVGGFGTDNMPADLLRLIPINKPCYINPHTRIRAGVVRPFASF